ncbi:MAG: hypothetical protein LBH85_04715, partial [Treponema sp.]|nr:hypothetical protein [Treponema sp.]
VATGFKPSASIGAVNTVEFFVTLIQAFAFTAFVSISNAWQMQLGLSVGSLLAAPLSVIICKKLPRKALCLIVGVMTLCINIPILWKLFFLTRATL